MSDSDQSKRFRAPLAPVLVLTCSVLGLLSGRTCAETLPDALTKAYYNNPNLNAQRAAVRAADENIPIAESRYLPHADATGDVGLTHVDSVDLTATRTDRSATSSSHDGSTKAGKRSRSPSQSVSSVDTIPRGVGVSVDQTFFDGFRTTNSVRSAESDVFSRRETLREVEQSVLQSGAQAYADVLRDTAIVGLQGSNIKLMQERLREAHDRLAIKDVTRVDFADVQAKLELARAAYFTAQSNLQNSIASYRQVFGEEPVHLDPATPVQRGVPASLTTALAISQIEHPSVQAALHAVDRAELQVKVAEGQLYPTITTRASLDQRYDFDEDVPGRQALDTSVVGSVSQPIFNGGANYGAIRQAKEELGMQEARLAIQRDDVRAAVVSSWGVLVSSKAALQASRVRIDAAELTLNGTREEEHIGQRTILDVITAQQSLLDARVALVDAQRDQVVASYAILASTGRLSPSLLDLKLRPYDAVVHFEQVKDKWFGLRTPDGR